MVTRPGKPIRIPEQTARRIVNLMAASSLCLIWTLYGLWAYNLQQERMHIMTQTLERQLNVMEEHVRSIFTSSETFLAVANRWIISHPDADLLHDSEFSELVKDFQRINNKSLAFRLADADGTMHVIPSSPDAKPANVSDRDYFISAMEKPPGAVSISAPLVGRATGHRNIAVATKLSASRQGAIVAFVSIEVSLFEDAFAKARSAEDGIITLVRRDGVTLARVGSNPIEPGRNISASALFKEGVEKSDRGMVVSGSVNIDHIRRLVAFSVLKNYPLVIGVGAGIDSMMADARAAMMRVAAIMLLVSLLLLAAQWKINYGLNAQAASHRQLEASHDRLATEVEERRQIETALKRSEADLRAILDNMSDMFCRTDGDGRLTMISRSVKQLLGYEPEEMLGRPASMLHFDPQGRTALIEALRQSGSFITDYQFRARHKLGHAVWLAASAHFLGEDGNGVEGVCRDIGESRRQLEEIQRSNAELEQFAYVASHDLREPLRMISSYLSLLERRQGDSLSEESLEFLAFARDGAKRMDRLVLDLLDYSRVGRRGSPLVPMAVLPIAEQAVQHLSIAIENSEGQVDLDATLAQMSIVGDAEQILRLFQNLIGNALKYRAPDRTPEVRVSCRRDNEFWEICVADNGIGIEEPYRERIFGLFQRLHTHENYEGTGIGLAVCRKIVERHGGHIRVESNQPVGCCFLFTLPSTEPFQPSASAMPADQPLDQAH